MIQEISITNTLSIKARQTISFEAVSGNNSEPLHYLNIGNTKLLKLAAIYGSNASGKTNMLKAINYFLHFILNAFTGLKPQEHTGFVPFVFDPVTIDSAGTFDTIFFLDSIKYEYHLSLDAKSVHSESLFYSPKGQKKRIFQRACINCQSDYGSLKYDWKWGDTLTGSKAKISSMTRPNVTFLNTAAQLEHPKLGKVYNYLRLIFMPIIYPDTPGLIDYTIGRMEKYSDLKNDILNLLVKSDFGSINDIKIRTRELPTSNKEALPTEVRNGFENKDKNNVIKELLVSHNYGIDYYLPIAMESAGTQRMLKLSGPLFELIRNRRFICIDEIESSLHQELLEFLLKTFLENSKESQILFTTHNLDLLDSEYLLDEEIWFCEKAEDGGSEYTSLVEYTGIRKGASRKKIYSAGKFGAKPILSSFTMD